MSNLRVVQQAFLVSYIDIDIDSFLHRHRHRQFLVFRTFVTNNNGKIVLTKVSDFTAA